MVGCFFASVLELIPGITSRQFFSSFWDLGKWRNTTKEKVNVAKVHENFETGFWPNRAPTFQTTGSFYSGDLNIKILLHSFAAKDLNLFHSPLQFAAFDIQFIVLLIYRMYSFYVCNY